MAFSSGILLKSDSLKLKEIIDDACNIGTFGDHSLRWISQIVSEAIGTGIHSTEFHS